MGIALCANQCCTFAPDASHLLALPDKESPAKPVSFSAELWLTARWTDLQVLPPAIADTHLLPFCLQLKVGNAEVFGTELPLGEQLALQGQKIAVSFNWTACFANTIPFL